MLMNTSATLREKEDRMKAIPFNKEEKAEAVLLYNKYQKVQKVADIFASRKRFKGKGNVWYEVRAALLAGSSVYQKKQAQKLAVSSKKKLMTKGASKRKLLTLPEPVDRLTAQKECYRLIERRYNTLPQSERKSFILGLNGMAITLLGMSEAVMVRPNVVPVDFHARRDQDWVAQA
jgi:hypothetical protein